MKHRVSSKQVVKKLEPPNADSNHIMEWLTNINWIPASVLRRRGKFARVVKRAIGFSIRLLGSISESDMLNTSNTAVRSEADLMTEVKMLSKYL